jgi:HD-like signal output (HDOD) protein
VLSLHVFSQYQAVRPGGISVAEVWTHSLRTAEAARSIGRLEGLAVKELEEAFVGGLLHDTGKVVLACNCAYDYARACRLASAEKISLLEAERRVFACTHPDVGGYLLGLWGLPVPVVEALTFHHAPALSLNERFSPLTAVHAANALVHEREAGGGPPASAALDLDYLSKLGVADHIPAWRDELQQPGPQNIPL